MPPPGIGQEELIVAGPPIRLSDPEEELLTTCDNEWTLSPRAFVAVSSLSRQTLAGAENDCLRIGDLWQEDEVSSLTNNDCFITECKNKPILLTQDYLNPSVLFTEG